MAEVLLKLHIDLAPRHPGHTEVRYDRTPKNHTIQGHRTGGGMTGCSGSVLLTCSQRINFSMAV